MDVCVNRWYRSMKTHVDWGLLKDLDLTWADEHAMKWPAREIDSALDGAIVLSLWFEELDADPFAWREGGRAAETDGPFSGRDLYKSTNRRVRDRHASSGGAAHRVSQH